MRVTICDVGPRDGLQNEPETLAPRLRAEFVNRLAAAGLPRVEAASFVRTDAVPQMAGAEQVVAAIDCSRLTVRTINQGIDQRRTLLDPGDGSCRVGILVSA